MRPLKSYKGKVEVEWGQDLDYSKEKVLTQDFDVPHFLTHYPKIAKPFYHRVDPSDDNYVLCHDLLAPEGYGEIIGGGERTWSEQEILARLEEEGTPKDAYQFYIDTRSYGGVPHGGFGLGVDRVCSWLSGADHIREVIPFPRDSTSYTLRSNMQPIIALGCGLVGEYVIHRLADDGYHVTAVDIRIPNSLAKRDDIISIEHDAPLCSNLKLAANRHKYAPRKDWPQHSDTFD